MNIGGKQGLEFFGIHALLFDADNIASLAKVGRNIDLFAVDKEMSVRNQLACFGAGRSESAGIYHIIQTAFADNQQVITGHAGSFLRHQEIFVELTFVNAIKSSGNLLRAKMCTVVGKLFATLTMLTGRIAALIHSAFIGIASVPLQEQLFSDGSRYGESG